MRWNNREVCIECSTDVGQTMSTSQSPQFCFHQKFSFETLAWHWLQILRILFTLSAHDHMMRRHDHNSNSLQKLHRLPTQKQYKLCAVHNGKAQSTLVKGHYCCIRISLSYSPALLYNTKISTWNCYMNWQLLLNDI